MQMGFNSMAIIGWVKLSNTSSFALEGVYIIGNVELPVRITPFSYENMELERSERPGKRRRSYHYRHWQDMLRSLEREFGLDTPFHLRLIKVDLELGMDFEGRNLFELKAKHFYVKYR